MVKQELIKGDFLFWFVATLILVFFGSFLSIFGAPDTRFVWAGIVLLAVATVTGMKVWKELKLAEQE